LVVKKKVSGPRSQVSGKTRQLKASIRPDTCDLASSLNVGGLIEPAGLSVTAAAALRVSRPALSSLLNGKADLSGDMALRIEKAFGVRMISVRMKSPGWGGFFIGMVLSRSGSAAVPAAVRWASSPAASRTRTPSGQPARCQRYFFNSSISRFSREYRETNVER
jgi:antitoxin HigA-1